MKLTLLEIVKLLMSDMDSDEITSINDTPESLQVANMVKETYIDIISRANLPEHYSVFELASGASASYPCVMTLPTDVLNLIWVKYDNADAPSATFSQYYQDVKYMDTKQFFERMYSFDPDVSTVDTNTITIGSDSIPLVWENDKFPEWYTTYDDYTLLFDSYRSSVDTYLTKNKTVCYGLKEPTFSLTDGATPDLDSKQFSLLIQEAKSQAFIDLKQTDNPKAEQRARKGWLNLQRQPSSFPDTYYDTWLPNYSRKG